MVALFNFVLYAIPLLIYWNKVKALNTYTLLLASYTIVAFFCFLNYQDNNEYQHCTVIPFIFLWLMVMLELSAYKHVNICKETIIIRENWAINALTWIYIVSGFLSMYYNYPRVVMLFEMDDWANVRNDFYDTLDTSQLYSSQFERYVKNIHSYLGPFGVVMAFYQLSKAKINILYTVLLFTSWLGSTFFGATLTASRGIVVQTVCVAILGYVLFSKMIRKSLRKYLLIAFASLVVLFTMYFLIVTRSRFGEGEEGNASLSYLGHSMLAFNEGIMGSMTSFADGKYFFGWIYQLVGYNTYVNENALGVTHQHAFFTSIGMLYYDFGPLLTIIIVLLLSALFRKYNTKSRYDTSDVMVIYFFADYLIKGVFVNGMNLSLTWLMLFVVVKIVRFAEKIN